MSPGFAKTNWAGNIAFAPQRFHRPTSVEELQSLVASASRVRALGTGHSFNRIADTEGDLVTLDGLPTIIKIQDDSVTVSAGLRYGEVAERLHQEGRALRNLASLPHIGVAGACATGTHGSGDTNGCLATAVSGLQLVTASGGLVELSRSADAGEFLGAVVGLGSLGIVTKLTLDTVPTFDVAQCVYEDLPWEQLATAEGFDDVFSAGYSVSVFTDWRRERVNQVWVKRRTGPEDSWHPAPNWLSASLADGPRHPVDGGSADDSNVQECVAGPWHERLPHFRLDQTPSVGEELQSEYLLPRTAAQAAIEALRQIRERIWPVLHISEIRTVAADELWMSPCYQRDSVGIHFTWIKDAAAVAPVVAEVERQLERFEPRPHWGKVFSIDPEVVRARYPRAGDFQHLTSRFDPEGKFRNAFTDAYLRAGG